jgi:hypothetical protein
LPRFDELPHEHNLAILRYRETRRMSRTYGYFRPSPGRRTNVEIGSNFSAHGLDVIQHNPNSKPAKRDGLHLKAPGWPFFPRKNPAFRLWTQGRANANRQSDEFVVF